MGVAMIIIEDITQQRVAEESRNAFVAQATHELRTPLTNIRLYAETALDEGKDNAEVRSNALNIINQEAFRLDRIVNDILSIAEIEAGTFSLRRDDVRLEEVFPELQRDYAAQAKEKRLTMVWNLPPKLPVIKADQGKFALALHNLLGNALKYTPEGGQVTVTVTADRGRLAVDVADSGIGIGDEDCQRIFEKFYRARDPRVGQIKGTGLGLAIAREVIRLHGGDITVHSILDKAAPLRCRCRLPRRWPDMVLKEQNIGAVHVLRPEGPLPGRRRRPVPAEAHRPRDGHDGPVRGRRLGHPVRRLEGPGGPGRRQRRGGPDRAEPEVVRPERHRAAGA